MKTKLKIGDLVKLNPNKKQLNSDIRYVGYGKEYNISYIHYGDFSSYCTILIEDADWWEIHLSSVMRVSKKCK